MTIEVIPDSIILHNDGKANRSVLTGEPDGMMVGRAGINHILLGHDELNGILPTDEEYKWSIEFRIRTTKVVFVDKDKTNRNWSGDPVNGFSGSEEPNGAYDSNETHSHDNQPTPTSEDKDATQSKNLLSTPDAGSESKIDSETEARILRYVSFILLLTILIGVITIGYLVWLIWRAIKYGPTNASPKNAVNSEKPDTSEDLHN